MHCEYLLVDNGCDWQAIEAIGEGFPQFDIVTSLALIIKPVYTIDRGTFVVSTENEEVLRILDLVCEKEAYCLKGLLPSIYVVTEEKVIRFWWEAAVLEKAKEVVVLAMYIAANLCKGKGLKSTFWKITLCWTKGK